MGSGKRVDMNYPMMSGEHCRQGRVRCRKLPQILANPILTIWLTREGVERKWRIRKPAELLHPTGTSEDFVA